MGWNLWPNQAFTYLIVFNLCIKRFLCLRVWYRGSCVATGSNWSKSTSPSSGRIVSHQIRQTLSLQDVTSMLATEPLQNRQYRNISITTWADLHKLLKFSVLIRRFILMSFHLRWWLYTDSASLPSLFGKYSGVVSYCFLCSLEFIVFHLFNWLPPKAREPSLCCYLTSSCVRGDGFIHLLRAFV